MKKEERRERMRNSASYALMERIAVWMDRFYVDAIVGMVLPWGLGDLLMGLFSLVYVYFALTLFHSIPLALAIINNTIRDVAIGLIPFFIGDILDFFHKANRQNLLLMEGFADGDRKVIHEVNTKAVQSVVMIIVLLIIIALQLRMAFFIAELGYDVLHAVWTVFMGY